MVIRSNLLTALVANAQRLSIILLGCTLLGAALAIAASSAILAVRLNRSPPIIYDLQIIGDAHSGGNMRVREHVKVPDNCLPRYSRKLVRPPDAQSDGHTLTQVLTDASVVADGDMLIPLPRDVPPGQWTFMEFITTQGCGALSGILPPQLNAAREPATGAGLGKIGVPVTILPAKPITTIVR